MLGREGGDPRTVAILLELRKTGFISCDATWGGHAFNVQLTEKGSQFVAGWPGHPGADVKELIAAIDRLIADAGPDERSRLEKLRDGVAGVEREVLTDVLANIATSQIPS